MGYSIFLIITLALLGGFIALTRYEAQAGIRFFSPERNRLDEGVAQALCIRDHVDIGAFVRDEIRRAAHHSWHALVTLSLQGVRAVERSLTRLVRSLRAKHTEIAPSRENAREFVKTLSDFKDGLKATHPDISDI